jgi:hypothetical protein
VGNTKLKCLNNVPIVPLNVPIVPLYRSPIEPRGVNLAIANFTNGAFLLNCQLSDEEGTILAKLAIPIRNAMTMENSNRPYNYYYYNDKDLNFEFNKLVVHLKLLSAPSGELVAQRIAFWPGDAGVAYSAGSNRILVMVGIRMDKNRYFIDLTGKDFL